MTHVTVVGLGQMGTALAQAFLRGGHTVTVWNRTSAKCEPLRNAGAIKARDIAAALEASPVSVICVDNYPATRALLQTPALRGLLANRTVIQLSTGTPVEARQEHEWMRAHEAKYLDGGILNGPNAIGTNRAQIVISGDEIAWNSSRQLLESLAGSVRYEAGDTGTASALDLAWLTSWYGSFVSIAHACNICAAEQIDIDRFMTLLPSDFRVQYLAGVVRDQAFMERTATLSVWKKALMSIQAQARDMQLNSEFPDFVADLLTRAEGQGFGEQNVMAMFKTLTKN